MFTEVCYSQHCPLCSWVCVIFRIVIWIQNLSQQTCFLSLILCFIALYVYVTMVDRILTLEDQNKLFLFQMTHHLDLLRWDWRCEGIKVFYHSVTCFSRQNKPAKHRTLIKWSPLHMQSGHYDRQKISFICKIWVLINMELFPPDPPLANQTWSWAETRQRRHLIAPERLKFNTVLYRFVRLRYNGG